MSIRTYLLDAVRNFADAFKANRKPALVLWLLAVGVLVGYYNVNAIKQILDIVSDVKTYVGGWFAPISTALFGAVIPGLVIRFGLKQPQSAKRIFAIACFWAFKGVEVDWLYKGQAWAFGSGTDLGTLATKVFIDQFVYVPTIGNVTVILWYHWVNCEFDTKRFRETLGKHWYRDRVFPIVLSNMAVWVPIVTVLYCLPTQLQLPLQNIALCFWTLLLAVLTSKLRQNKIS